MTPSSATALGVGDAVRPGAGQQLVEDRLRVTRRPAAGAHHQRQHRRLDGDALGGADRLEVRAHHRRRDQPERVVVGARADGREHLVRLGGGEDEDQEVRRLLDELEQRVEALRGHHVRLVDDVDLVPVADRREERAFAQVAGVVDAAVAGGVDLDDVDRAGAVGREFAARVADAARVGRRALGAVQAAGQDARAGGLAAAARTAEQVGVVDAAGRQRLAQRLGDVVLPDDLGEGRRAVLAVQREIGRRLCHASTLVTAGDGPPRRRLG